MEQFPDPTMGADNQGWRSVLDIPKFSAATKKEIALLEEMRPNDNFIYTDKDGRELWLAFYRFPEGSTTKFTKYRGDRYRDKKTKVIVDTREYKTPFEGATPECQISFYVITGMEYDISGNPVEVKKYSTVQPSEFASLIGWKKGDGIMEGKLKPDTTPGMPEQFKDEPKRVAKEKAKDEGREEAAKEGK